MSLLNEKAIKYILVDFRSSNRVGRWFSAPYFEKTPADDARAKTKDVIAAHA